MDWKQVLEIASPVTIIFAAGMLYQEIRTFRVELKDLRQIREEWSGIKVTLEQTEEFTRRNTSDIKELRERIGKTREEFVSSHELDRSKR